MVTVMKNCRKLTWQRKWYFFVCASYFKDLFPLTVAQNIYLGLFPLKKPMSEYLFIFLLLFLNLTCFASAFVSFWISFLKGKATNKCGKTWLWCKTTFLSCKEQLYVLAWITLWLPLKSVDRDHFPIQGRTNEFRCSYIFQGLMLRQMICTI